MSELENHCKDCCCAKCWDALGITKYTGKSIPEHVSEMAKSHQSLVDALEEVVKLKGQRYHYEGVTFPAIPNEIILKCEGALSKARQGETR